jgi:acetyl esterase/lipase
MERRTFIRQSAIGLSAAGLGKIPVLPQTSFQIKTVYLWKENSANNGPDPKKRPRLDIYLPEKSNVKPRAIMLVLPGGAYSGLAPHEGAPFAEYFAAQGLVSAVLSYRVAPNRYPAPMDDAARAIRLLRSMAGELNANPRQLGLIGFSAGGHLAASIATRPDGYQNEEDDLAAAISARPDKLLLGYPVISFTEFTHQGSVDNLLGNHPDPALLKQLSNQYQVTEGNPPAFMFHTADDQTVPVQNSLLFTQAYVDKKLPVALHVFPHGKHGVGLALNQPELSNWSDVMRKWLGDWCV